MPLPRRSDFTNYKDWQDANVAYCSQMQIAYCEARAREREAAESVDEWTWEPEPTADGLEDLL